MAMETCHSITDSQAALFPWCQSGLFGGRCLHRRRRDHCPCGVKLEDRKGIDGRFTAVAGVLETYIYGVRAVGAN
jgi:hypothetical protein